MAVGRIDVQPAGVPVSVSFTNMAGAAVTAYSDAALTTPVLSPCLVGADTAFYLAADGPYIVSVKLGGAELGPFIRTCVPGRAVAVDLAHVLSASRNAQLIGHDEFASSRLSSGQETFPRLLGMQATVNTVIASGTMCLIYFTARKTETVGNLVVSTASTAAGATPTVCRMGLYAIAANGDGSLVASTPNDTALFNSAFGRFPKALSAPYAVVAGSRYAVGVLVVTGATMPNFTACGQQNGSSSTLANSPRIAGLKTGLSDLPASFTEAAMSANPYALYAELLP